MQKAAAIFVVLALSSLLLVHLGDNQTTISEQFEEWRATHGLMLDLSPQELIYRQKIFEQNVNSINQHNSNPAHTYKQGVNKFTAYTPQEFEAMFLTKIQAHSNFVEEPRKDGLSVDWVSYGAVSPVKNQGSCTATYAFSAIGAIEGISVIFYKTQQEYSVQQLIDCSQTYGNSGCTSGNMVNSYQYIAAKGIQTWNAYPYTGKVESCKFATGLFKIKGYSNVTATVSSLESALISRPISVAVDGQRFQNYHSGIFDDCGTNLSLAALLVGGTDQYYRVKNSWGTSWGENGYIRLSRNGNICGICSAASYPLPA